MPFTRALIGWVRDGWAQLTLIGRVGVVLFQAAWLAQLAILGYLLLHG